MSTTKPEWKIAFDNEGNHCKQIYGWMKDEKFTFQDSDYEFSGFLKYKGIRWNNSTINTLWECTITKILYYSNQSLLENALLKNAGSPVLYFGDVRDEGLIICGTFHFKKSGAVTLIHLKK